MSEVKQYAAHGRDLHTPDLNCDEYHCELLVKARDYDALLLHLTQLKESVGKAVADFDAMLGPGDVELMQIVATLRAAVSNTSGS